MKSLWHVCITSPILLILWWFVEPITITLLIPALALSVFPEIDIGMGTHRNFIMHSSLIWLLIFFFNMNMTFALLLLSVSLHCIIDSIPTSSAFTKGYKVKLFRKNAFKREREGTKMMGFQSFGWLFVNGLIGIGTFIIYTIMM